MIKSGKEVRIDFSETLGFKKGDMTITPGETFRCNPVQEHLQNIPLVLKRTECIDRRVFDGLIYEMDTLMRFRGHPNVVSLFGYWSEPAESPYRYKTLVALYEEGTMGDLLSSVVLANTRPSSKMMLRWIVDITKALRSFHSS